MKKDLGLRRSNWGSREIVTLAEFVVLFEEFLGELETVKLSETFSKLLGKQGEAVKIIGPALTAVVGAAAMPVLSNELTPVEEVGLRLRLGLKAKHSLQEVADYIGMDVRCVKDVEKTAKAKLRNSELMGTDMLRYMRLIAQLEKIDKLNRAGIVKKSEKPKKDA